VISTLATRNRLLSLLLAVAFAVVAVLLGNWQWSRHQDRLDTRTVVESNYGSDPVALRSVLDGPGDRLTSDQRWTRVEVQGRYDADEQLLVRNRPFRGTYGYEVVVPLLLDEGATALLVNRGWVPNARDAATLPEVPPVPQGPVTVTGWLRPGEADLDREPVAGQLASIDLAEAAERSGLDLYDAYLVLEAEQVAGADTTAPPRPEPAEPPDTGLGSHLAYALQWWLTAPVGLVLVLVIARRDLREARGLDRVAAPARTRRTRIWDEEDG
jgi:cytochrome oxidase assembly protein ShyY1